MFTSETAAFKYVFILLSLRVIESHSLDEVKDEIDFYGEEYDGVDVLCGERYGAWDMEKWCEERDIKFIPVFPNYNKQLEAFKELFLAMKEGRYKIPTVEIPGSTTGFVLTEELTEFDHDSTKKWFGSMEKNKSKGVQDDCVFSIGWGIYGGKDITPTDFRVRRKLQSFGMMFSGTGLLGKY